MTIPSFSYGSAPGCRARKEEKKTKPIFTKTFQIIAEGIIPNTNTTSFPFYQRFYVANYLLNTKNRFDNTDCKWNFKKYFYHVLSNHYYEINLNLIKLIIFIFYFDIFLFFAELGEN